MSNLCKNEQCLQYNTDYLYSCRSGDLFCILVNKASQQSEGVSPMRDWRASGATSDASYVSHLPE